MSKSPTPDANLLDNDLIRIAFEKCDKYKSKLMFKRGGSVFAENVPPGDYVDPGMQASWVFWQEAWAAATPQMQAQPNNLLAKAASDFLDSANALQVDTDATTSSTLTAFDRTRSRLQHALTNLRTSAVPRLQRYFNSEFGVEKFSAVQHKNMPDVETYYLATDVDAAFTLAAAGEKK